MKIRRKIPGWLLNKYVISLVLFGVWITFFDENNIIAQLRARHELGKLRQEKQFYTDKIADYDYQLKAIDKDHSFLEKFVREHYYMSKENEEVFVVVADTVASVN